ncbi:MAG: hypothetical protein Q8L37_07300 [Candidatus Gottesmanbacteria bacterium]|nr:hypothetical protein [Candidatus Gottesmanbacteria bacterium]
MYLVLIALSLITLVVLDWKVGLPVAIIVFCLDRVIDRSRRELEEKINKPL